MASKLTQQMVITKFLETVTEAPIQKSAEWHAIRKTTIGGSEISSVLNINPFKSRRSLIADKAGISTLTFNGCLATRWGNTFEQLTREWIQRISVMDGEIQETGSIEGVIARQRYSPDGLGVVKLLNENDQLDDYIVLFEFKAPFSGLPDGKIPKHYIPQIQTGLLSIPICDLSIFVNNCYRKCALSDLGFAMTYDTNFHSGDAKKRRTASQRFDSVLSCGIIGFYQTKENYENAIKVLGYGSDSDSEKEIDSAESYSNYNLDSDINILMNSKDTPLDFGTAKEKTLNRLFILCEEARVNAVYYPMILNQEAINDLDFVQTHKKEKPISEINVKKIIKMQINQFGDHCDDNEYMIVGYLPWKLVKSDIIIETIDETWKEKIEEPIRETLKIIDEIKNSDDPQSKYYEYYPNTNRITTEDASVYMADLAMFN
jgi:hypothetical protein